jgi:predicted O-methyltransferase YrrM
MDYPKIENILKARPNLHQWGDGGLEDVFLRRYVNNLAALADEVGPLEIIETGAGLSTLLFLACEPARLVSIAPDAELQSRIFAAAEQFGVILTPLEFVCAGSQDVLPGITSDQRFNCALIDGNHSFPMVFLDFFYINRALRVKSSLTIDDVHLGSGRVLFEVVRAQPQYDIDLLMWKTVTFRKVEELQEIPQMCPYNNITSFAKRPGNW